MDDSRGLIELDLNVDNVQGVNHSTVKRTRNTWKEEHKLALVNQVYLGDCCPIGKRTHKEVNDAWAKLMHALTTRSDGMFDGFNLSIPAVRRQMKELMERQKSMNRDALGATGLGGSRVHTDLEAGAQYLLDLQASVDAQRVAEKENKDSKLARLDGHAKDVIRRSMSTHAKRQTRSGGDGSGSGLTGRRGSAGDFALKLQSAEEFASAAMESFIERSARMEWMTKMQFHATHPDLGAHPGDEQVFVEAALAAHRSKMKKACTSKSTELPEDASISDDIIPREEH